MKKFISLLMSFVIMLSFTMGMSMSAFADDGKEQIVSATLTPIQPYTLYEGVYDDDEYYSAPAFNVGDKITINYSNGNCDDFILKKGFGIHDFANDKNEVLDVEVNQFKFKGTGRTSFVVKLVDYGKSIDVPVTIIENPVESFSLVSVKPYEVIEKASGEYYNGNWWYPAPEFNDGDKIIVKLKNGTSKEYICNDSNFLNEKSERLLVKASEFNFNGKGKTTFNVILSEYRTKIDVPVSITENPVKSFSLIPAKPYKIIENTNGEYDNDGSWSYNSPDFNEGDKIVVNYTNGPSEEFVYKKENIDEFVSTKNKILKVYGFSFKFNGTGKASFDIQLKDYDKSVTVPVEITKNPVVSISFKSVKPYEIYEGAHADYDDKNNRWFYYPPEFNECDKFTIQYEDTSSEDYIYKKAIDRFINNKNEILHILKDGVYFNGTGKTSFEIEICDYGKKLNIPLTITENPIESFSVIPEKKYELTGKTDGIGNRVNTFFYIPYLNDGDKILVKFKNGTSKEYSKKPQAENIEYYNRIYDFVDNDNNQLKVMASYFYFNGTGETSFEVTLSDYGKFQYVPIEINKDSSNDNTDTKPTPGGDSGNTGGSTGGTTGGGGGITPAPTPEDTDKKDEDKKPETNPAQPTAPTDTTEKPANIKVNKALAKKKALVVYWNKIANASGYQIQVATDKKFKKNKKTVTVAKQNASKKTVKNLKAKKKYFVRVRSYKIVDGKKSYGKWSKIKSIKTK